MSSISNRENSRGFPPSGDGTKTREPRTVPVRSMVVGEKNDLRPSEQSAAHPAGGIRGVCGQPASAGFRLAPAFADDRSHRTGRRHVPVKYQGGPDGGGQIARFRSPLPRRRPAPVPQTRCGTQCGDAEARTRRPMAAVRFATGKRRSFPENSVRTEAYVSALRTVIRGQRGNRVVG
jgi:hypothetical protein